MHAAGFAFAERTPAIAEADLRDGLEGERPHRAEQERRRDGDRGDPQPDEVREAPFRGRQREDLVGSPHQPTGESDPFGLETVEQGVGRAAVEDGLELPGEIDGVADPRIHALAAGGAVDVRRVADQKGAPLPEMLGDAMVQPIGRKPVHCADFQPQIADRPAAHVFEAKRLAACPVALDGAHEANAPFVLERKDAQKIGLVEVDVQFAVDRGARRLDVRDVEGLRIVAAGKADAERLANERPRPRMGLLDKLNSAAWRSGPRSVQSGHNITKRPPMGRMKLDKIDRLILRSLQEDGRMTNVELARRANISAPPCLRRVRALEESGVIAGYHADIDPTALGYGEMIFAQVGLSSQAEHDLRAFEDLVLSWPEVRECFMLRGEWDFMLKIVAKDGESYNRFLTTHLTTAPNVVRVKSADVIRRSKYQPGAPIPAEEESEASAA